MWWSSIHSFFVYVSRIDGMKTNTIEGWKCIEWSLATMVRYFLQWLIVIFITITRRRIHICSVQTPTWNHQVNIAIEPRESHTIQRTQMEKQRADSDRVQTKTKIFSSFSLVARALVRQQFDSDTKNQSIPNFILEAKVTTTFTRIVRFHFYARYVLMFPTNTIVSANRFNTLEMYLHVQHE